VVVGRESAEICGDAFLPRTTINAAFLKNLDSA